MVGVDVIVGVRVMVGVRVTVGVRVIRGVLTAVGSDETDSTIMVVDAFIAISGRMIPRRASKGYFTATVIGSPALRSGSG